MTAFSMPAIGIMTMIQSAQSDPSVMQASYKVSPAILDILSALYHPTE